MNIKSKKAVSPLIATVLLIAFAVALGAVVMNWGRNYVDSSTQEAFAEGHAVAQPEVSVCDKPIALDIVKINNKPNLCYDSLNKRIQYTIENKGTTTIDSVKFQIIGSVDIFNTQISTLAAADIKKSFINYDESKYGSIQQARFIPVIETTPCPGKTLAIESIGEC